MTFNIFVSNSFLRVYLLNTSQNTPKYLEKYRQPPPKKNIPKNPRISFGINKIFHIK